MEIICILGKTGTNKRQVEKLLSHSGYNKIISYTTRQPKDWEVNHKDYNFITRKEFMSLVYNKILFEYTEYKGELYGAPHPFGHSKYVMVVTPEALGKIKSIYKHQVFAVYIDKPRINSRDLCEDYLDTDEGQFDRISDQVDLVIADSVNTNQLVDIINASLIKWRRSR